MRLIDANKIKWQMVPESLGNGRYVDGYVANERDIDAMPTIEAIPLSFIRDEVDRLDKCNLTELADYMRNVLKYYDAVQRGEETW